LKPTNIVAVLACALLFAGCNRRSSDTGSTGTGIASPSETGQGTGTAAVRGAAPSERREIGTNSNTDEKLTKPADNTGRNVRDRSEASVTPGDQSESKADIDLVSRIRRAVTQNDQLSTTAKNTKIIANNGKVTLRGPVNTAAEKEQVVQTVRSVNGVTEVDDQLEVKANP
jgi:hyperosmotically inducible periplasmic protein